MGSIDAAATLARLLFVALIIAGFIRQELARVTTILAVVVGLIVWLGLPIVTGGDRFVTPALAAVDIVLVLVIFKGDVRIT